MLSSVVCTILILLRIDSDLDFHSVTDDPQFLSRLITLGNSENLTYEEFLWVQSEEDSASDSKEITELKANPEMLQELQSELVEVRLTSQLPIPIELLVSAWPSATSTLQPASVALTTLVRVPTALAVPPVAYNSHLILEGQNTADDSNGNDIVAIKKPADTPAASATPAAIAANAVTADPAAPDAIAAPAATADPAAPDAIAAPAATATATTPASPATPAKPIRKAPKYGKLIDTRDGPRAVHMLTPATNINDLVCKSLFSSALNDYPHPILINFNHPVKNPLEAHFLKISAINQYINSDDVQPNDLILIFDAFDVWFQLDFERLVARYYQLQDQEKARKGSLYSESVIFGADKGCWPNPPNSDACKKVPNSTISSNVYGPETDHSGHGYRNRPRWLNSGTIMGPADVVQQIFKRASASSRNSFNSDQYVLANIWAAFDLPIMIDYTSLLFQTLTYSHSDVVFLYQGQIEEGDVMKAPRIDPITGTKSSDGGKINANPLDYFDILENTPLTLTPFLNGTRKERRWHLSDKHTAWNRVSGNVPAVIHLNGDKSCLKTWWHKMWWVHDVKDYHQWFRLKHVRNVGGAFLDNPDGTIEYRDFNTMCKSYEMFGIEKSKFDGHKVRKGERPSIGPEPFMVGMNPHSTPADVWDDLINLRDKKRKADAEKAAKAAAAANQASRKPPVPKPAQH